MDQVTAGFNPRTFLRSIGVRQVRLAAGLVLFSYLLSHFINHSLGNISLAAMEYGLWFHMALWRSLPGTLLKSYGQTLYNLWLVRPDFGVMQVTVLLVAWIHGCIGIYLWLRLRSFFPRIAPLLLVGAVMLPSLALLGFYQQGQVVLQLAQQPEQVAEWRSPARIGTPAQRATLENIRNNFLLAYAGAIGLVFLARGVRVLRERRRGMIRLTYPDRTIRVPKGLSVLEASFRYRLPHASVCGGKGRCSTCRIRVHGDRSRLPRPSTREAFVLERVGASADPAVRLACQLRPQSDISLVPILPPQADTSFVYGKSQTHLSEERYLACMFVDMRGSTEMAQKRLPFDTVFIVNRFLAAVSQAVMEAGGQPNQYVGDGLLALFGLNTDRATACRQALNAAAMVAGNVDHLNKMFAEAERNPIRFGIGVHAGEVITGDIGYRDTVVFTALGDTVNVTARLEELTKELECQVVLSDEALKTAGLAPSGLPSREIVIRGHARPMTVRTVADAASLSAIFDTAVDAALTEPQERLASAGAA